MPVRMTQVGFNEGQDWLNYKTSDTLSIELQALICSTGDVVFLVTSILVLLCKELQEDWDNLTSGDSAETEIFTLLVGVFELE